MKNITAFLLPGVGCDYRIFERLNLPWPTKHVKWPKAYHGETLEHFSRRVAEQIDDPANTVVIGVSFGGMVAAELSNLINPAATVIISSVKNSKEIPGWIKFLRFTRLHRLVSSKFVASFNFWTGWALGCGSSKDKGMIRQMVKCMDGDFNDWAVDALMSWDFNGPIGKVLHIHGTDDKLFPSEKIDGCVFIEEGSHSIVFKQGGKVSELIKIHLADLVS